MPIVVTENWSALRYSKSPPWTATREFVVTGTTDADAVLAAVGIPLQNDLFPYGTRLKCRGPAIRSRESIEYWVVEAVYGIPEAGEYPPTDDDALNQATDIRWETVELNEPVDTDLDGRVICARQGEPLPPSGRPITYKRLTLVKNFPFYDFSLSDTYENSVNETGVSLAGVPVAAEHMRCAAIIPATNYLSTAPYIPMMFVFEIFFNNDLGAYPFQHRYMNQGTYGWYNDGGTLRRARFSNGKGELLDRPVRLNGSGLPAFTDADVKVGEDNQTPVALSPVPDCYAIEINTDSQSLIFKRTRLVDFTALLGLF